MPLGRSTTLVPITPEEQAVYETLGCTCGHLMEADHAAGGKLGMKCLKAGCPCTWATLDMSDMEEDHPAWGKPFYPDVVMPCSHCGREGYDCITKFTAERLLYKKMRGRCAWCRGCLEGAPESLYAGLREEGGDFTDESRAESEARYDAWITDPANHADHPILLTDEDLERAEALFKDLPEDFDPFKEATNAV